MSRWALALCLLLPQLQASATETLVVRTTTAALPAPPACRVHHIRLARGGTLSQALSHLNVSQAQVLSWNHRLPAGDRARELRPGDGAVVCLDGGPAQRRLVGLEIQRRGRRAAVLGHFPTAKPAAPVLAAAFRPPAQTATDDHLRRIDFKLEGPLAAALAAQHLSSVEAGAIEAWLRADADLPAAMPAGTRVGLLLGRDRGRDGERLLRLRIWYQGSVRELFSYVDHDGRRWVLDRSGLGILHLHLETPLDYTRISSGWGWRDQPVLHVPEFHKGIDFAAPMGTPVRAAASGVVQFTGWHGNYGRLVIVQHTPITQTRYGHLSRVARGLHDGSRVSAGQIIGYVGSSGLSTGPHLYYELYLHDLRVDPLTAEVNLPVRLAGPMLHAFHRYVARIDQLHSQDTDAG